jgi:hypothetical protein
MLMYIGDIPAVYTGIRHINPGRCLRLRQRFPLIKWPFRTVGCIFILGGESEIEGPTRWMGPAARLIISRDLHRAR